jgi:hypothetical protein
MKKILILCGSILAIGAGYLIWLHSKPEHYGAPFSNAPLVSIAQLLAKPVPGNVRVDGQIVRQCPVSGCWFYLDDGKGRQIKIDLGKTLPQLPQKIGRRAKAEGRVVLMGNEPVLIGSSVEFQ